MDSVSKTKYLSDPCRHSSVPYWKAKSVTVPEGMQILHHDDYDRSNYMEYIDEPYFRLFHDLKELSASVLPQGYSIGTAAVHDFATHINSCYDSIGITEEELRNCMDRPVYDETLWLALKDDKSGRIVATGIAELDREIGEGILEWIQVSEGYRGYGLGSYIVSELLRRMKGRAGFATVSGQCNNPANPEGVYRKCGFTGSDVWHILSRKDMQIMTKNERNKGYREVGICQHRHRE